MWTSTIVGELTGFIERASDTMSQRILVIEGDPVLRDSMWRLLSDHGHQVQLAANGAQAAERSLSARFDTLILDVSRLDIGAGFLTRLLGADGARGPTPSLLPGNIGLRSNPERMISCVRSLVCVTQHGTCCGCMSARPMKLNTGTGFRSPG